MGKGDLAYPCFQTKQECCDEASERLSKYFGLQVVVTPANAGDSLYAMHKYKRQMDDAGIKLPLEFSLAMCSLYGANMGPLKAT